MRTRINNITFTADTRSIDTSIADLTIEDIRLIVNETQKKVLCSSMQKSLVASIVNGVVTYVTSYTKVNPDGTTTTVVIPPLAQGDKITFEIDKGDDYPSAVGVLSEIAGGKQAIASAINTKGGSASATESFAELAEAVAEIPNYSDMVKLAGIIAGGNYNKNALQGHNENVKYGKTEIVDNVGAFEKLSYNYMFQYWDLLKKVYMPAITDAYGYSFFFSCTSLEEAIFPNLKSKQGFDMFSNCTSLKNLVFGTYTDNNYLASTNGDKPNLRNITMGEGTDANLRFEGWKATNVIAEGQSGIDELNTNLYNNLLTKLYDHSSDGVTRTLRLGWLSRVTAENIAYANAKGWTLTT